MPFGRAQPVHEGLDEWPQKCNLQHTRPQHESFGTRYLDMLLAQTARTHESASLESECVQFALSELFGLLRWQFFMNLLK